MSVQALEHLLYHECGLLGVSGGISSDMRELSASHAPEAREAIALFVRSVVREIGSLAAILGVSMRWSLPVASVSTPPKCATRFLTVAPGWGSSATGL